MKAIEIRDHMPEEKRRDRKLFKRIASAVAFTLALATACGVGWYAGAKLAYQQKAAEIQKIHYVEEGETLWDIAAELSSDDQDIREVIYDLAKLNNIAPDADLKVGQKIVIAK
ncbi:LysM peptidoglycan-binding domain-containing protein [Megasphaera sp. WILCCON 0056]|uniref:LysM peptidoglycan-binding domain-containing protein n=1 Tax=Megasphaera sp. WILCCON 0056 TaxID=3345340 RepID=UPI003A7FB018